MKETKEYAVQVDVGDNATELIEGLAQQIGLTTSELLPYYEEAVFTYGVCFIAILVVGAILSTYLLSRCAQINDGRGNETQAVIMGISGAFIGLVVMMLIFFEGGKNLATIISPEAYAIREMTKDVQRLIP